MSFLLSVRWTIKPVTAPRPLLSCSGCGRPESFESSGKFRLNANGKRLDAWLLYRCIACEATWKRPIVERRNVQALEPAFLQALQSNDRALAEAFAFDATALNRFASRIEVSEEAKVQKAVDDRRAGPCSRLEISLCLPYPIALRGDRLLARELGLSRERIKKLEKAGKLIAKLDARQKLRRPLVDELHVTFDLSAESDAESIAAAAGGDAAEDACNEQRPQCPSANPVRSRPARR